MVGLAVVSSALVREEGSGAGAGVGSSSGAETVSVVGVAAGVDRLFSAH